MKKEKNLAEKITHVSEKAPVSSPFMQEQLVSKVNALTFNMNTNSLSNPQNKNFEKGLTLNNRIIIDELNKFSKITSML